MPVKEVKAYAKEQGLNTKDIVKSGQLVTDGLGVEQLLKLLNEDLVTGSLSGVQFEVERKSVR